jgi:hypothetical protein
MTTTEITGISERDAARIPKLGSFVWYECASTTHSYEEVEAILTKHGLDADSFPAANRKKAYHHAVKSLERGEGRTTVDRLPRSLRHFAHQVTTIIESSDALDFEAQVTTRFDREDESVTVDAVGDDVRTHSFSQRINKQIADYMNNVHVDVVRDWLQAELGRLNAVSARRSGGLYFVSKDYGGRVEALEAALAEMGSVLFAHPVFDTRTWRTNAAGFVTDDLVGDFATMKADLDALVAEAKTTGEIKKYKLETMLNRFTKLESKEGLYQDLLSAKIGDLTTGFAAVKKQIASLSLGKVAGIEPVDTAHEVRERARAAKRDAVAKDKAAKAKALAVAEKKKSDAKAKLDESLKKLKGKKAAKKAHQTRRAKKAVKTVYADSKSDTPF